MGQQAVLHARDEHDPELQPFDLVERDERQVLLRVLFYRVLIGHEGDALQQAREGVGGGLVGELRAEAAQLPQVLEPVLRVRVVRLQQPAAVAGALHRLVQELGQLHRGLDLAQPVQQREEAGEAPPLPHVERRRVVGLVGEQLQRGVGGDVERARPRDEVVHRALADAAAGDVDDAR